MPDPIGGRRREDPSDVGAAVPVMSPWDLVFERLDRLERTQSDVARMVLQIHEALPAVTGFAVGQGLALGSPIDSRNAISSSAPPPPIIGIPPPQRIDQVTPAHAVFAETELLSPVPDAMPTLGAIPEPPPFMAPPPPPPPPPGGFSLDAPPPPPPPGFMGGADTGLAPPPPPGGFSLDAPPPPMGTPLSELTGFDFTMPEPKAGRLFGRRKAKRAAADRSAVASLLAAPPPPPPPGFMGGADTGLAPPPPPGGFSLDAPPPPPGFAPQPAPGGFAPPSAVGGFSVDTASPAPLPSPPGFGDHRDYADMPSITPLPGGSFVDATTFPSPPAGFGATSPGPGPPPPPGFAPGTEPWLSSSDPEAMPVPGAPVPPPPGFTPQIPVVEPGPMTPPHGYAPVSPAEPTALPPLQLDQHQAPAPPPGFGRPSDTASEVAAAMTPAEGFGGGMIDAPPGVGMAREGQGPDLVTVPPITPDFFARSGRRRR